MTTPACVPATKWSKGPSLDVPEAGKNWGEVNVAAYLSFVLVLGFVAMVWGFKADERMREDQRLGRANAAQSPQLYFTIKIFNH